VAGTDLLPQNILSPVTVTEVCAAILSERLNGLLETKDSSEFL
jgi:hypothetical protein